MNCSIRIPDLPEPKKSGRVYFLVAVDPGPVSPYDLMWDQRIKDRLAELGADYDTQVVRVGPSPAFEAIFADEPGS